MTGAEVFDFLHDLNRFERNQEAHPLTGKFQQYTDYRGAGLLYLAVEADLKTAFLNLIRSGVLDHPDQTTGQTGIMLALRKRWAAESLEGLMRADVAVRDWEGNGLLHYAAAGGSKEVLSFLVQAGLDIHQTNRQGNFPFHTALEFGNEEAWMFFIAENDIPEKAGEWLEMAVKTGNRDAVSMLGKRFPELLNRKAADGLTPVHRALLHHKEAVFFELMEGGADPLLKDRFGNSTLHYAASLELFGVQLWLLERFPQLANEPNEDGLTPAEV